MTAVLLGKTGGRPRNGQPAHLGHLLAPLLVAGVFLVGAANAPAQSPERRDIHLTLKSRQALLQDRDVAALRLTVQVRRGVATIWGPVPSEEMTVRAQKLVEQVPGIYEVRTDCYAMIPTIKPAPLDWPQPAVPPQQAVAKATPPAHDGEPWDGIHVVTRHKVLTLPEPDASSPQKEGRPAISLLAPVTIPVPPTPVKPDLWIQAEKLCKSDPAFRHIKIDVHDGVVTLSGRVARAEQRMALAQKIARLPGVDRVSVGEVDVDR